jgi:hypothetical protein
MVVVSERGASDKKQAEQQDRGGPVSDELPDSLAGGECGHVLSFYRSML